MISEFKLRSELALIERTPDKPVRKARRIVRLVRQARRSAVALLHLGQCFAAEGDGGRAARFLDAARRLQVACDELREKARVALKSTSEPAGFGYRNVGNAYPKWAASLEAAQSPAEASR